MPYSLKLNSINKLLLTSNKLLLGQLWVPLLLVYYKVYKYTTGIKHHQTHVVLTIGHVLKSYKHRWSIARIVINWIKHHQTLTYGVDDWSCPEELRALLIYCKNHYQLNKTSSNTYMWCWRLIMSWRITSTVDLLQESLWTE